MKNIFKKLGVTSLALITILNLLTACGGGSANTDLGTLPDANISENLLGDWNLTIKTTGTNDPDTFVGEIMPLKLSILGEDNCSSDLIVEIGDFAENNEETCVTSGDEFIYTYSGDIHSVVNNNCDNSQAKITIRGKLTNGKIEGQIVGSEIFPSANCTPEDSPQHTITEGTITGVNN